MLAGIHGLGCRAKAGNLAIPDIFRGPPSQLQMRVWLIASIGGQHARAFGGDMRDLDSHLLLEGRCRKSILH
jgi:hypothetical protein